jgi:hypothetical protein
VFILRRINKIPLFVFTVTGYLIPPIIVIVVGILLRVNIKIVLELLVYLLLFKNAIFDFPPYLILILGIFFTFRTTKEELKLGNKYGAIISYLLIVLSQIFFHSIVWVDVLGENPSASAGMTFLFFPPFAIIFGGLGYICGWFFGCFLETRRKKLFFKRDVIRFITSLVFIVALFVFFIWLILSMRFSVLITKILMMLM